MGGKGHNYCCITLSQDKILFDEHSIFTLCFPDFLKKKKVGGGKCGSNMFCSNHSLLARQPILQLCAQQCARTRFVCADGHIICDSSLLRRRKTLLSVVTNLWQAHHCYLSLLLSVVRQNHQLHRTSTRSRRPQYLHEGDGEREGLTYSSSRGGRAAWGAGTEQSTSCQVIHHQQISRQTRSGQRGGTSCEG